MEHYDVAVVGLGAFGSATLYALSRRGRRAIGFERFEPGHDRGSSHGESRLIRLAYFEDPAYVPLVRRAYRSWDALERASGEQVLVPTGIVEAGVAGSEFVARSLACAQAEGIAHEVLAPAAVNRRFPAFALPDGWDCVFQPDAGVLRPEKAIDLFLRGAREHGGAVHSQAQVTHVEPDGAAVVVRLASGETFRAGAAVIAAGPWIGELVPELKPHLSLTRQVLAWFGPTQPALVAPERMPAFLLDEGRQLAYGMPDLGHGVKAAFHDAQGVLGSADAPRAAATDAETEAVHAVLRSRIPAAAGPLIRTATCVYTRAPDDNFIVGLHPDDPRLVIASPCSGHGFKFAGVLGEALADLATLGSTQEPIALFDPRRLWPG